MESLARLVVFLFIFTFVIIFAVNCYLTNKIIMFFLNEYSNYWWLLIIPVNMTISFVSTLLFLKIITKLE